MKVKLYDDSAMIYGIEGTGKDVVPSYAFPVVEVELHTLKRWQRAIANYEKAQKEMGMAVEEARKLGQR